MAVKSFDKANSANRQIDILKDFSGGLNTELADSATKDNQFRKLTNFDIDKAGSLMKRPGLYKVPYVEKLLNRRLEDVIKNQEITIDGKPVDKTQFEIQDCIPFFDGIHWVYNYISTFGVFVILLDKNMNIPTDIGDLDLTTDEYKIIAQFYPIENRTISSSTNSFKIAKYNDQYVMYKTLYQVNFAINENINKRQVIVYSWNPLYNDSYLGHDLPNDTLYPQWLEASWDKDKVISDSSFGNFEGLKEESNYISNWINYDDAIDISVNSIKKKYVIDPNGFLDKYDIKVTYQPNTPYSQLLIKRKLKTENTYQDIVINLKHQNGDPITDEQISNIYLYDAQHIQINLFRKINYSSSFDLDKYFEFKGNFAQYKRYYEKYLDLLKSTIKWFWVNLETSELIYSDGIMQILPTDKSSVKYLQKITPQLVELKKKFTNYETYISAGDTYSWNLLFKKGVDATRYIQNSSQLTLEVYEDLDNNYLKSRANRINFSNIGAAYNYSFKSTYQDNDNNFFISILPAPVSSLYGSIKNSSLIQTNLSMDKALMSLVFKGNSNNSYGTFKNNQIINDYLTLMKINPFQFDINISTTLDSQAGNFYNYTSQVQNIKSYFFPFQTMFSLNLNKGSSLTIFSDTWANSPSLVVLPPVSLVDVNNDYFKNSREIYKINQLKNLFSTLINPFDRIKIWVNYSLGMKCYVATIAPNNTPSNGVNNSIVFLIPEDKQPIYETKHLINEQEDYFGFGNSTYTLVKSDGQSITISAATMNKNTFNYINPSSLDFVQDLLMNNLPAFNLAYTEKSITPLQLFGKEMIQTLERVLEAYKVSQFVSPKLYLSYKNQKEQFINIQISTLELMDYIIHDSVNYQNDATIFTIKYTLLKNNQVVPLTFELVYHSKNGNKTIDLIDLDEITKIINDNQLDWISFFNSIKLVFSGKLLISANSGNQVINFKQQIYTKPTLNDIVNIWYNLILFSKFPTDQNTDSRQPDIYNSKDHPYISNQLMEYPNTNLQPQYSSIQLFGLQPVNDLITNVGTQRFQLFYALNEGKTIEDFKVALTTMSVSDYSAMINSSNFSTDIVEGENKKTPNWTEWSVLFNIKTNKKGVAIFELEVPSTTSPYLILVQVAEKNKDDSKKTINLATLVETRIELQPSSNSSSNKLNINAIFDEFVLSNKLVFYSSNLIAYGNSNKIFFNEISNATYFPLSRIVELKTPEAIKSANIFQNKLIISTENSKFYIGGSSFDSSTDPFYLREIASDSGVLAPKSDIPMGNYLYFLDTTGIKILKNLYGTADKEFAFESIDTIIKSIVAKDKDACAATLDNKYFICFPNYKYMLVYHFDYKAWVTYESVYFNFSTMFVNDGELYGVDRDNFKIFKFDNNVYVDNWNEVEEWYELYKGKVTKFGGYAKTLTVDNQEVEVQQGAPITCELETKQLDQDYTPHRKKYDYVLISSYLEHDDIKQQNFGASLKPIIKVDNNLINYKFSITKDDNVYNYVEETNSISIRENSALNATATLNKNRLGLNSLNNYYYVPVKRKGNTISIGFKFDAPTNINIDSLYIRYGLTKVKKSRGGIS